MNLQKKTDEEIIKIAKPIWDNLVKSSNIKDYGGFTRDFSSQMLYGASEVELKNISSQFCLLIFCILLQLLIKSFETTELV